MDFVVHSCSGHTLETGVDQIRAVRSGGGRRRGAFKFGFRDTPLGAEGNLRGRLAHDVCYRLRGRANCRVRRGFGRKQTGDKRKASGSVLQRQQSLVHP